MLSLPSLCFLLISIARSVFAVHKQGIWGVEENVHIIAKFGVRQINVLNRENTRGFIYGNVSIDGSDGKFDETNRGALILVPESQIQSVLVDSMYTASCGTMLRNMSKIFYEPTCFSSGARQDLFRWVPCPNNDHCSGDSHALRGYQFTFHIEEPHFPELWYLILLSCKLDVTCNWITSIRNTPASYDVWLVNGNPESNDNVFSKQFSFEHQSILHINMISLILYSVIGLCQMRAASLKNVNRLQQRQRILNKVIALKTAGFFLLSTDMFVYATFGRGTVVLAFVGELCRIAGICGFCLLLLLFSRGWNINRSHSKAYSRKTHYLWFFLSLLHVIIFLYSYVLFYDDSISCDLLSNRGIVSVRIFQGLWFLIEVKKTIQREEEEERAVFLVHFGAAYMVWFVYIVGLWVIGSMISYLWHLKVVLAIATGSNFVAIACLVHILWPTGSYRKFFSPDTSLHRAFERSSSTELDDFEKSLMFNSSQDSDQL